MEPMKCPQCDMEMTVVLADDGEYLYLCEWCNCTVDATPDPVDQDAQTGTNDSV